MTSLVKVIAYVDLESEAAKHAKVQRFRDSDWANQPERLAEIEASILDPAKYQMNVALAAQLDDGREITGGCGFGFSGPRRGVGAIWHRYRGPQLHEDPSENDRLLNETYRVGMSDVEDAVNQMLGRDPEQHRPPRLSWEGLQRALADEGINVTEQQLIDAPLQFVLSESAAAEVDREAPT